MIQGVGNSSTNAMAMQRAGPPPGPPSGPPPSGQEMVSRLDTDGDGSLSKTELQKLIDEMTQQSKQTGQAGGTAPTADELLQKLDTDGDGQVSAAELEAGRPQGPPPGAAGPPPGEASGQRTDSVSAQTAAESNLQFLSYLLDNGDAGSRNSSAFSIKV